MLSNQRQIIEQAKFPYSTLGEAFQKQIETIEKQGEKRKQLNIMEGNK